MFKRNALETVDIGIGVIGFFAFAFLVITIVAELTGIDALGWALTLFALVTALCLLLLARRRITASEQGTGPHGTTARQ